MKKVIVLVTGFLFFSLVNSEASLVSYSDRSSFDAAVGSTSLIDFEGILTEGLLELGGSFSIGDVTFSQADEKLYVYDEDLIPTDGLTSDYLIHYDNEFGNSSSPVVITFASSMNSVGLDMGYLFNWGNAASPGDITIFLNTGEFVQTTIPGPIVPNSSTPLDFVGFSSDIAFSSITIHDPMNSMIIDNFAYNNTAAPVPLPSTMLLFGTGLIGLIGSRLRRKKS